MKVLKARLYELEIKEQEAEKKADYASKDAIALGSQIRTYTLQPYRLVKDHRTGSEDGQCGRRAGRRPGRLYAATTSCTACRI